MEWPDSEDDHTGWESEGDESVLEERGVDTHGMKAEQMRQELRKFEDFSCDGVPLVEEMLIGRGHMCVFIPKFHCELNPIERCWCHAKKYTRAHCNGSIIRLRKGWILSVLISSTVFFAHAKTMREPTGMGTHATQLMPRSRSINLTAKSA